MCFQHMRDLRNCEDVCGFKSHLAEEEVELRPSIFEVSHQPSFPLSLDRFWEMFLHRKGSLIQADQGV